MLSLTKVHQSYSKPLYRGKLLGRKGEYLAQDEPPCSLLTELICLCGTTDVIHDGEEQLFDGKTHQACSKGSDNLHYRGEPLNTTHPLAQARQDLTGEGDSWWNLHIVTQFHILCELGSPKQGLGRIGFGNLRKSSNILSIKSSPEPADLTILPMMEPSSM